MHSPAAVTSTRKSGLNSRCAYSAIAVAIALTLRPGVLAAQEGATVSASGVEEIVVTGDPFRTLPNVDSASSFGFNKPLLETPRSVSFISSETIELFGLSGVEDLERVTPSVYSPARFGIQGSVNVRGISADTYIRGMKRMSLQGNARSVMAAMDSIEVVKGPPSPIYGMGKIGGYTNMTPKSGRASEGGYLSEPEGFAQAISGSGAAERGEFSAGVGGPVTLFGKDGGYYLYALLEDSDSYYSATPYDQKVMQLAGSFDDAVGKFRIETGLMFQESDTAGALTARATQELVTNGRIVQGTPLLDLDLDQSGRIGFYEMHQASPVRGAINAGNQPLVQRYAWPTDSNGDPLPSLKEFPQVPGIPESLYNYLVAECGGVVEISANCPDPTGLLRAQGIGGPVPMSGYIPLGMALDPRNTGYATVTEDQRHRASSHERELNAKLTTFYFDLVNDQDSDFTMRNQFFVDTLDQYKISNQPLHLTIDATVMENKFTVTKRLSNLPDWLQINSLGSANIRRTSSETIAGFGGDLAQNRVDITDPHWIDVYNGRNPNNTFETAADNPAYTYPEVIAGGTPYRSGGKTVFSEYGIGTLFDITMFEKLNFLVGGRYDYSIAENEEFAGTFNENTGTTARPGAFRANGSRAKESDSGTSWSASVSYAITPSIRPYLTFANASATLDSSSNRLSNDTINYGHIGSSEIKEIGLKTSLFDEKMFFTLAGYEQTRTNVTADEDDPTLGADISSTLGRGVEAELRWIPLRNLNVGIFGLKQKIKLRPVTGGVTNLNARALGFMDVVDPATGEVIYPAEAFLFGGRVGIVLPDGMEAYETWSNNPETQYGVSVNYQVPAGYGALSDFGVTFSGNYNSEVCSGDFCTITLPSVSTYNMNLYKTIGNVYLKLDVLNLTDEEYYRPRLNNSAADELLQAMPGRRYSLSVKMNF